MLALKSFVVLREEPLFGHLNVRFNAGEIWLIQGPNGRGKTSLLRALAGIYREFEGELSWDAVETPLYMGHLAGLHQSMTLLENLRQLYAVYGLEWHNIDPTLLQLGLFGYEDTVVSRLSAGQMRKVALAPLLHRPMAPRPWLLDEPFTSLDSASCSMIEALIETHVQRQGLVLLTSHQPLLSDSLVQKAQRLNLQPPAHTVAGFEAKSL